MCVPRGIQGGYTGWVLGGVIPVPTQHLLEEGPEAPSDRRERALPRGEGGVRARTYYGTLKYLKYKTFSGCLGDARPSPCPSRSHRGLGRGAGSQLE